jgi:beta-lactamase class C
MKKGRYKFGLTALSIAMVVVSSSLSFAQSAPSSLSETHIIDTAEIDRRAQAMIDKLSMAGLAIATVENGEITFAKGYGTTKKGDGEKITEDTVFRWASVSKGVAAHIIATMAARGDLSLRNSIEDYQTSLSLPQKDVDISVAQLLSHQVGIVRNAYDNQIEAGKSAKETRQKLSGLRYICPPAECHTYQNVAYDTASEIIESVTHLPYKSVAKTEVFDKFGMETATVTYEGLLQSKSWAKPHSKRGRPYKSVKRTYYRLPAAAGVNSSVKDLARWMIAQMPDENLAEISRAEQIQYDLQTPLVKTGREERFLNRKFWRLDNSHYGLGFRIYDYEGHKVVGHRGGVQGYRALILFDPEKRSGIAMMWNSSHSQPIGLQMEFMDQLYGLPKTDWLRLNERS